MRRASGQRKELVAGCGAGAIHQDRAPTGELMIQGQALQVRATDGYQNAICRGFGRAARLCARNTNSERP